MSPDSSASVGVEESLAELLNDDSNDATLQSGLLPAEVVDEDVVCADADSLGATVNPDTDAAPLAALKLCIVDYWDCLTPGASPAESQWIVQHDGLMFNAQGFNEKSTFEVLIEDQSIGTFVTDEFGEFEGFAAFDSATVDAHTITLVASEGSVSRQFTVVSDDDWDE